MLGHRNRSVLVRVPLAWLDAEDMVGDANPQEKGEPSELMDSQTVEFRCPDGSANTYLLLAGLAVAARHGLEMEAALELVDKLYVDVNIFSPEHEKTRETLPQLPASCWESADTLLRDREIYERDGVFPAEVIDEVAKQLKSHDDRGLSKKLQGMEDEIRKLADEYLHCW